jgi:hypothetical protein
MGATCNPYPSDPSKNLYPLQGYGFSRVRVRVEKKLAVVYPCRALFIYAATVCLFVGDPRIRSSAQTYQALENILSYSPSKNNAATYRQLDTLYHTVLASAHSNDKRENEVLMDILCLITTTQRPLSQAAITQLLMIEEAFGVFIESALNSLQSVISVPDDHFQPIQIFHASFPDFLSDSARSQQYHLIPKGSHHFLAKKCLQNLTDSLLKDNICRLADQNVHVSKADTTQLSQALHYACIYWIFHFLEVDEPNTLDGMVIYVFEKLALRWIECMSLLGKLDVAVRMLRSLENTQFVRESSFNFQLSAHYSSGL